MAKSITSTLIGAAIKDGLIGSIDDQVVRYVPALTGSAYDGATVRDVLMMASGARWNETYTDPASDRRQLLEAQLSQKPGLSEKIWARLGTEAPANWWLDSPDGVEIGGSGISATTPFFDAVVAALR